MENRMNNVNTKEILSAAIKKTRTEMQIFIQVHKFVFI